MAMEKMSASPAMADIEPNRCTTPYAMLADEFPFPSRHFQAIRPAGHWNGIGLFGTIHNARPMSSLPVEVSADWNRRRRSDAQADVRLRDLLGAATPQSTSTQLHPSLDKSPDPSSVFKMHIKCLALALGALATVTSATPVASPKEPTNIVDSVGDAQQGGFRGETSLYVCTKANFDGRCENLQSNLGQCYSLVNGFNDKISSLGPSEGTTCTVYKNRGCTGPILSGIRFPGITNLKDRRFNDIITSYKCEKE
ncbi:MAG: hypothetical protein Q9193_004274 [Seirophora villosa]